MPRHLHLTKFLIASIALHALLIIGALFLVKPAPTELPFTPVRIVNLPQQEMKQLPLVERPEPARPSPPRPAPIPPPAPAPPPARVTPPPPAPQRLIPEKPLPPSAVPLPKKFGESEELTLPKTSAGTGVPEGAEQGGETGKGTGKGTGKTGPPSQNRGTGPLPFLSQNDIDQLARKGMPEKKPGDDSVTLDTDEFKFMSYNRWLKIKVESILKYPELAAVSGYQGALFIKFDINKDGTLGGLEILQSSGYKILDDEALRAIRAAAPFQALPDEWKMDRYSIRAAVIFYLGTGYIR